MPDKDERIDNNKPQQEEISREKDKGDSKKKAKGKLTSLLILFLILFVWILILAILVKINVGGFGTNLRPLIKDIPIINKILPEVSDEELAYENDYPYKTIEEAMAKIEELEEVNENLELKNEEYKNKNSKMHEELEELADLRKDREDFNQRVLDFDKKVVTGDKAPDITEYIKYYKSINPDNAEIIYRQVIHKEEASQEIKKNADIYSNMDPKAAARIFETLSTDTDLLILILSNMKSSDVSAILSEMKPDLAGALTKKLFDNN